MRRTRKQPTARPRLLAVVNTACTGCEVCLDFCPVDCITPSQPGEEVTPTAPPVHIHDEECIGCQVCARVCEHLTLNAIEMVPVGQRRRVAGGQGPHSTPGLATTLS